MKYYLALFVAVSACACLCGQTVTSSPLPIVLINTDGNISIPDEYKVPGTMKILYVNDTTTNYLANQNNPAYIHYEGRIGIERRGSSTQRLNKRHYGFETRQSDDLTNDNVSLLGMPAENDWTLNPLNYDNAYLRDPLTYALARRTGYYAPRTHYCEVFVGGNYRGIYCLTEKIKADKSRVNIAKLDPSENTMPKLSGGYIIKADKTTGGDTPAWSTPAHNFSEYVNYIYHYPKPEDISIAQGNYIESYFDSLQAVMNAGNRDIITGYPSLIDIPSFVDYMLIGELASNVDVYQLSTFFHKERKGKLYAGPVWDYNYAYGNDPFHSPSRSGYDVWQFDNRDNTGSEFWYQLFHDTVYHKIFCRRWHELTAPGAPLAIDSVMALIDSLNNQILALVPQDKQRWGYTFNQSDEVNALKTWLRSRYTWLNTQLTDTLLLQPAPPSLAFTKIHYHPKRFGILSADKQEFIGITNLSGSAVSLAGMYLSELGIAYKFDSNAEIDSAQEIYLAADTAVFRVLYGKRAMGQFARSLNNHSQRLVLSDAWGKVIDDVTYSDDGDWPSDADGGGAFLTLPDPYSDNNNPQNWQSDTLMTPLTDCIDPINLTADEVGYYTARLQWEGDSMPSLWVVSIVDGEGRYDSMLVTANPYILTHLNEGETYRVMVKAICAGGRNSEWSNTVEFHTHLCPAAKDVMVTVDSDSALVRWTGARDVFRYVVSYCEEGASASHGTIRLTNDTHLTLHNLRAGRYDLYVMTMCDSLNYSQWSERVTFEVSNENPSEIIEAEEYRITVSPNPATSTTTLMMEGYDGEAQVAILDVYGRVVRKQLYATTPATIDLKGLTRGVYLVKISCGEQDIIKKIILAATK